MMLHPSNISGYREIMLAARKRRMRAFWFRMSAFISGSISGAALVAWGWPW